MENKLKSCFYCQSTTDIKRSFLNNELGQIKHNIIYSCNDCRLLRTVMNAKDFKKYIERIKRSGAENIFSILVKK